MVGFEVRFIAVLCKCIKYSDVVRNHSMLRISYIISLLFDEEEKVCSVVSAVNISDYLKWLSILGLWNGFDVSKFKRLMNISILIYELKRLVANIALGLRYIGITQKS